MAPKIKSSLSAARQLVQIVWDNVQRATDHSWQRLNAAMFEAVKLAVQGGLPFSDGDFEHFSETMRMGYWIGEGGLDFLYRTAVSVGNATAYHAIESYCGRTPLILDDHRIYVGYEFVWDGNRVTCTSLDKESLIACVYGNYEEPTPCGSCGQRDYSHSNTKDRRKVTKRYEITVEEIRAGSRLAKEQKEATKKAKFEARIKEYRQDIEHWLKARAIGKKERELKVTIDKAIEVTRCEKGVKKFARQYFGKRKECTIEEMVSVAVAVAQGSLYSVENIVRAVLGDARKTDAIRPMASASQAAEEVH